MATKEKSTEKIEREYVIPLRKKGNSTVIYKKTPKAVRTVKEFIAKHMKVKDRDTRNVKLDIYLNEALWHRGIRNPIHKIKVKAVKEGDIVKVQGLDLPTNINFKKIREDKKSKEQKKIGEKAKKEIEEMKKANEEELLKQEEDLNQDGVNDKLEEKEKAESIKEINQEEMKKEAKGNKTSPEKGKEKLAKKKIENRTSQNK